MTVDDLIAKKLENFPSINFISIEESEDRRKILYEKFEKYGIKNIRPHIFKRYDDNDHIVVGRDVNILAPKEHRGPVTSHLKAIRDWYENTDEEYTIFCEDDLSFETVEYWSFTWQEFFNALPEGWGCIQLSLSGDEQDYFNTVIYEAGNKMRPRNWSDWSCVVYLMKRSHAKKIVENYYYDDVFRLEYKGWDLPYRIRTNKLWTLVPNIESLAYTIFEEKKYVFICALFVEDVNFSTTWGDRCGCPYSEDDPENIHLISYQNVIDWWRTKGLSVPLSEIISKDYLSQWL